MWAKAFSQYQEERVEETVNAIMQYWKSRQLDAQKEQVNQPVMSLEGALLSLPSSPLSPFSLAFFLSYGKKIALGVRIRKPLAVCRAVELKYTTALYAGTSSTPSSCKDKGGDRLERTEETYEIEMANHCWPESEHHFLEHTEV